MSLFKKVIMLTLSFVMSVSICFGCGSKDTVNPLPPNPDPPIEKPKDGRIAKPTSYMLDDFNFAAGGFTESEFYINNNRWGEKNNGVKGDNVSYTSDGDVVLKAYGDYTDKVGYKRSGACLLSHEYMGPGMIEVAMKFMPRLGGCTAIWPYFNGVNAETGKYQYQEIDIEMPAGAEGNKVKATFEKAMNTNYAINYTDVNNVGAVRSRKKETLTPTNDGAWHKYGIKWETDPKPRIRYYIDDVVTSDTNEEPDGYKSVSIATAPLQIGVWFPNGWAGDRNFDSAYALVDWVSYEPYLDHPKKDSKIPSTIGGLYPITQYPTKPMDLPEMNYISNGDFQSGSNADQEGNRVFPWGGDFDFSLLKSDGAEKIIEIPAGKKITQTITGVYGKTRSNDAEFGDTSYYYEFDFSGQSIVSNGTNEATITVEFLDENDRPIESGTKKLAVNSTSNMKLSLKSVNGSKSMKITIAVTKGKVSFDNLKMSLIAPKKA